MAGLKYKASDGTYKPLTVYNVTTPDVVQTTGTEEGSEKAVMSQSAVTTEFQKYVTKTSFNETISGYSTTGDVETVKSTLNTHTGNTDIHVNSEQVAAIAAVSSKANISDLTAHTANTEIHVTSEDKEKWNAVSGKAESNNVYTKAEVDSAVAVKANSADLTAHTADSTVHITADERNAWNAKADADDVYTKTEADDKFQAVGDYVSSTTLSNYSTTEQMNSAISSAVAPKANSADVYTKGEVDSAVSVKANSADVYTKAETYTKDEADSAFQAVGNYVSSTTLNDYSTTSQVDAKISAATSGKADSSTVTSLNNSLTGHTTNGTIHITADERSKWNAKAEVSQIPTKVSQLSNDKNFITYAKYDDTAKTINFYADSASTAVVSINAAEFVKDGMVNSASVSGSNLVITFNTDAGKDNIAIPISSIFNANNYYTTANTYSKTEVDNKLAGKSNTDHTHAISGVTGLQSALDGKSPTNHTHVISGVTGLQAALDGKSNTGHIHAISDVTNLQSALDGKSGTGHTHNYAGSSSAGGAANSVAGTLTLQFNGTTNQTYNGSAAKTFNVTPAAIGAAPSSHSHNYAGSSSAGGAANSAVALTTATAGSATQPVYFTGGKPAACSYTLGKSVPADAVFTDTNTHYASNTIVASASTATSNGAAANGNVYLNHIENGGVRNAHKIVGGGATTVTSDTAGTITISSTNTTYGTATTSANGLMSSTDKSKLDGIQAGADAVSFARSLTGGTKIGTLTINGTGTDLYCQTNTDTNTTYSAGAGIGLNGTQFYNKGVRSIGTGSANGTISVNTNGTAADVAVKGLGSAAYTNSNAYAAASHSHDDRYYTESETNNLLNAKLSLAGGTMTGNINYTAKGNSYIGNGPNDAANGLGGALNNLVISSWYGVSFTTSCAGQIYTNKNAVSINCRDGHVYANTFVGNFSGNATSANKVANALTLQFNGTTNQTYDGSGAKTFNVTPAAIGAAPSSHSHNYAGSSSAGGAANSVANSLTLQFNGTTNQTYNGSGAKTFNVTPAAIGALPKAAQQFSAVSTTQSINNATCPFTFTADGQNGTVMYYNSGSANVTITVSTNYKTPTKEQLNITIVPGGYGEVNYLRFNSNMIVARGL